MAPPWTSAHDRALARAHGDDDDEPEIDRAPGPRAAWDVRANGRRCKHPATKVGDRFGAWRVTALLPADSGRNERVEAICTECHRVRATQVFNLRAGGECRSCRRAADSNGGRRSPAGR